MSAPGIEHRRVSALVRGSMEHTNRYTKEIGTPETCYTGRANHRLRTGMTPKGREARGRRDWLE